MIVVTVMIAAAMMAVVVTAMVMFFLMMFVHDRSPFFNRCRCAFNLLMKVYSPLQTNGIVERSGDTLPYASPCYAVFGLRSASSVAT